LVQDRNGSENFKNRALIRLKTHIGIGIAGGELEVEARNCREAVDTLRECLEIIGTGITKAPIHGIAKFIQFLKALINRKKEAFFKSEKS
jgi:hypothetical protein